MNNMAGRRAQWTQEQMQNAINAVNDGELSQRDAADRFRIPRRTLRNHIKSGKIEKKLGRSAVLTKEQEDQFSQRIIRLCEIGLPLTPILVRRSVFKFCVDNNITHPFPVAKEVAGKDWLYAFMKRNPQLSKRKAQLMNPGRAQKLNKYIVNDYFQKLSDIYQEMDIHQNPQNLFNMDEKGCRLTIHHQQQVIGQKGTKRIHMVAHEHAENVTIAGCCNALGNTIPPMIIFKGKRIKPEWQDGLPAGTLVKMADKGSMTTQLFIQFIEHLARYKGTGQTLLVFDGASSHLDISIVDAADRCGIRLFCLPSNTTHELQPLDKAVYRSFEHHWDQELLRYWDSHPDRHLNKSRFSQIFTKVWPKCMTPQNIISGFKATGMFPLDPQMIPESAFAPSVVSQRPLENPERPNLSNDEIPNILEDEDATILTDHSSESDDELDDIALNKLAKILKNSAISGCRKYGEKTPLKNDDSKHSQEIAKDTTAANKTLTVDTQMDTNNVVLNRSFKKLLPTPELFAIKDKKNNTAGRKKSLNYKAQVVTKDLFSSVSTKSTLVCATIRKSAAKESKPLTLIRKPAVSKEPKPSTSQCSASVSSKKVLGGDSWYCFLCNTEDKLDMRQCKTCATWCHEACLGFTEDDREYFVCPNCC